MAHVDDLTHTAQDYLKVIWSAVEWGDPPIATKGLAQRFGTTQAAVSDTVKRLAAQGLLAYAPYRPVTLTDLGEHLARAMVRRHRLIETFLTEVLHYGWEEVHDDAELLEHAASEGFLARIDALLGHPRRDPHGDAIPDADGGWIRLVAPLLADAGPGSHRVARVADTDPDQLTRLSDLGIAPGTDLIVDAAGAVGSPAGRLALDADDWRAIRVLPEGPRFAWGEPDADTLRAELHPGDMRRPVVTSAHANGITLVGVAPSGRLEVAVEASGDGGAGGVGRSRHAASAPEEARWGTFAMGPGLVAGWSWEP